MKKGVNEMILFMILLIMLLIIGVIAVLAISVGGSAFILVFGDLILCVLIIVWIIKKLIKKKK